MTVTELPRDKFEKLAWRCKPAVSHNEIVSAFAVSDVTGGLTIKTIGGDKTKARVRVLIINLIAGKWEVVLENSKLIKGGQAESKNGTITGAFQQGDLSEPELVNLPGVPAIWQQDPNKYIFC